MQGSVLGWVKTSFGLEKLAEMLWIGEPQTISNFMDGKVRVEKLRFGHVSYRQYNGSVFLCKHFYNRFTQATGSARNNDGFAR